MSWPTEPGRDPHVAYVVYDTVSEKYLRFINREEVILVAKESLCYATMFPTTQQAYQKIDNINCSDFGISYLYLLVKKVVLG